MDENGRVKDCIIIVCDNLKVKKTGETITNQTDFYQNVKESDCKVYRGRIDPMLKLYTNCEFMLTKNIDVRKSKANGTTGILEQVVLCTGAEYSEAII